MITRLQVRMARAALGWSARDLGKQAGIARNTVTRFENGLGTHISTLSQIRSALEKAGIIFIPADGVAGPGIRLTNTKLTIKADD
jgi:transcriptional regulator with XRE-family HTH domain